MNAKQIADELGISRAHVYNLKESGKLTDWTPQGVHDYKVKLAAKHMEEIKRLLGWNSPQFRLFLQKEL